MAESVSGRADGEAHIPEDCLASREDTSAQDQSRENVTIPVEKASTKRLSRGVRWLALLLAAVVLSSGWFLLPDHVRQRWVNTLMSDITPQKINDAVSAPHASVEASVQVMPDTALTALAASKEAPPEPLASEAVVPAVVAAPHPLPASGERVSPSAMTSEESKALMAAIGKLQGSMHMLEDAQGALGYELHVRQQLELRTRLRWIASTSTLLPQMASFWQDVTWLPLLNASERNEAKTMWKMAASDADKLLAWSTRLKRLAATLPVPQHQDIVPKPKQAVFSWLTGQFHLRPAPTPEQRALSELRIKLLNTAHVLTVEIWPKAKVWRHLLADLRGQFGGDADLFLPQHLDGIQGDIATMRAKATSWLGRLSAPVPRPDEHPREAGN